MRVLTDSDKQEMIRARFKEKLYNSTKTQKQLYQEIGISQHVFWLFSKGCDIGRISIVKIEAWLKDEKE